MIELLGRTVGRVAFFGSVLFAGLFDAVGALLRACDKFQDTVDNELNRLWSPPSPKEWQMSKLQSGAAAEWLEQRKDSLSAEDDAIRLAAMLRDAKAELGRLRHFVERHCQRGVTMPAEQGWDAIEAKWREGKYK